MIVNKIPCFRGDFSNFHFSYGRWDKGRDNFYTFRLNS
jgi:hypothetical protein